MRHPVPPSSKKIVLSIGTHSESRNVWQIALINKVFVSKLFVLELLNNKLLNIFWKIKSKE